MPVHIVERLQKMNRAERNLWTQLGREPTLDEIAEEASLPIQQAREVKAAARAATSLDQPVGEQEEAVLGDFVAGDGPLPDEEVEVSLRSQALQAALLTLSAREREVLALRYGLDDYEPKTLEEIGRRLGLTRERVRQIEVEALRRLATLREIQAVPLLGLDVESKLGRGRAQLAQRARLQLPHALPRDAEVSPDLVERLGRVPREAEPPLEKLAEARLDPRRAPPRAPPRGSSPTPLRRGLRRPRSPRGRRRGCRRRRIGVSRLTASSTISSSSMTRASGSVDSAAISAVVGSRLSF